MSRTESIQPASQTPEWEHLVTRRLRAQVAIAWNSAFGRHFMSRYRTGIMNTAVHFDGRKTDYYVDKEEHERFNKDLDNLLKNPEFVAGLVPEAREFLEGQYSLIRESVKDCSSLNNEELALLYQKVSHYHADYYTRMWMIFRICERIVARIEAIVSKGINAGRDVKEILRVLSTPLVPNDVMNERIGLLNIAIKSNILNRNRLLREHAARYRHIPMFDYDHVPYTPNHFISELNSIRNPEKELMQINESLRLRKKEYQAMLDLLNPDQDLQNLIAMLKKAVVLRDHRDMIRQKLNVKLRSFYHVIGGRIGMPVNDTALLTNDEIINCLAYGSTFSKDELNARKKSFLLVQSGEDIIIYSGEDASNHARAGGLFKDAEIQHDGLIRGTPASPGRAVGPARIVSTNLDLAKIHMGDIMVAAMTRQDFVPAIRKCRGIVTDEGGVTCHAAIIARELGIPCIVGAGAATRILYDGEIIEVDAKNGTIRTIAKQKNSQKAL